MSLPMVLQKSEHDNDDTIIDEDTAEKTADITEEQNETTVLESTDKTIELHESENSTNEDEKVTCEPLKLNYLVTINLSQLLHMANTEVADMAKKLHVNS